MSRVERASQGETSNPPQPTSKKLSTSFSNAPTQSKSSADSTRRCLSKSRRAPVVAYTELRVIERLLNPIEFSIIAVSMQDAGEFYDLGLFIDRVDNSIFSLRNPEAGESTILEMRKLFRIGWTGERRRLKILRNTWRRRLASLWPSSSSVSKIASENSSA